MLRSLRFELKIAKCSSPWRRSIRHFDTNIAAALGDVNATIILQKLDYWIKKEGVWVIVDSIKYIYNTYRDWTRQQFRWLSKRQFRNSMDLLRSPYLITIFGGWVIRLVISWTWN